MRLGQGLATCIVRVNTIDVIRDGMCGVVTRQQVGRPGNQVAVPVCIDYLIHLITQNLERLFVKL